MHALRFRFLTPSGRPSGWLYVKTTKGCAPTAATPHVGEAKLKHLVAVLDRSSAFLDGVRAAGRDPADIELVSVDLGADGHEISGTAAMIGLTRLREPA
jgi:hypothetical protein